MTTQKQTSKLQQFAIDDLYQYRFENREINGYDYPVECLTHPLAGFMELKIGSTLTNKAYDIKVQNKHQFIEILKHLNELDPTLANVANDIATKCRFYKYH